MIVHTATGLVLRLLLGAVLDAHERGLLTPGRTPALWAHLETILEWCATPGDETAP